LLLRLGQAAGGKSRSFIHSCFSVSRSPGCFCSAAAVLALLLGAEAVPLGDSSGEEELGDPQSSASPAERRQLSNCMDLAHLLHERAANWNKELCQEQAVCKGSMELLLHNSLNVPKIVKEDRCHYNEFQKEKCLGKISSGLYGFQTFLEYVEETSAGNAPHPMSILLSIQHLADTLKSMVSSTVTLPDPAAQKVLSAKLREHRRWDATVIKHHILQGFITFMEKTTRTIRVRNMKYTRNFESRRK
uniref:Interleukin-6 n=1 Tax=Salvator merianae TaxID=96440 RepID=A0A8D0BD95_SALMN